MKDSLVGSDSPPSAGATKGDEQLGRAVMAESGWYHGARVAFVPEAGWRLLFFQAVGSVSERHSPSFGPFSVADAT